MTASINGMAERLRALLEQPRELVLPGCYDVLSAMLLENAGFSSVFLSGYGVAASALGNPDIGLTTLSETVAATLNVTNAIRAPLVVDADNGYGNEENVLRTVRELEHAGAAALIMEDQIFPKRCGHAAEKRVVPLDHYLRKLECALSARRTPMVIVARTDVMVLDEAIERAKAFHAAGADVTLIDGLPSLEAARRVGREVPGKKQINLIYGGKTPILPSAEFGEMGFKIILYSTPALYAVKRTMDQLMRRLFDSGDLRSISDDSSTFTDFQSFIEGRYMARANERDGKRSDR
jgi:2-methylisocitrate lyase-like PEP mutase family enzyme